MAGLGADAAGDSGGADVRALAFGLLHSADRDRTAIRGCDSERRSFRALAVPSPPAFLNGWLASVRRECDVGRYPSASGAWRRLFPHGGDSRRLQHVRYRTSDTECRLGYE